MRRDDLKAAVDAASLEQVDRRSVQSMRDALARSHAEKTAFNYAATYNGFEREFAEFLVRAPDILRLPLSVPPSRAHPAPPSAWTT